MQNVIEETHLASELLKTLLVMQNQNQEIVDRARRTETRITRFMEAQGVESGASKPRWNDGFVIIPYLHTNVRDILAVIPDDFSDEVYVLYQGKLVFTINLP